jgi:hypothetical protein
MLTSERLRDLLDYDPLTGIFCWRVPSKKGMSAGSVAGWRCNNYLRIQIDKRSYFSHRLAWLYIHGRWPEIHIDHINGIPTDNRIKNLREATNSENRRNTGAQINNASGFKGVSWKAKNRRWVAQIKLHGKKMHIGLFDTPEAAHAAYCEAADRLHGQFARHG